MAFLASSGCPPHPTFPLFHLAMPRSSPGTWPACRTAVQPTGELIVVNVHCVLINVQCSFQICVLIMRLEILSPSLAKLEMRTASRMKSTSPGPSLRSFGHHYFHHWHLIQDDGGFPITGYKIDMLDIQTNNWLEITFIEVFHIHHINNSFCSKNLNVNKSPIIWCKNKIKFWTSQMIQDYLLTRQLLANATLSNCIRLSRVLSRDVHSPTSCTASCTDSGKDKHQQI